MASDLYIVGTGGLAREIAAMLKNSNLAAYKFQGYISEKGDDVGDWLGSDQIVGSDSKLPFYSDETVSLIIGIGHVGVRKKVANNYMTMPNIKFPNLFESCSKVDDSVSMGSGNIFCYGSFVSVDVKIGDFNLINWYTTIGHDVKVGSYCVINPHAHLSGFTSIGDNVLIGASATILENLSVCDSAKIGAGAVLTKNIEKKGTYVGVPARLNNENRD
jgi:sugar O-acyltransferase (sialic acid O-acetyltransferase NeuD family)